MSIRSFEALDYVIFSICLCFSAGIGIYHAIAGGRQKTTAEYYYGNRQMGLFPVALSLLVTYQSSIFLLGYPAETYLYGSMFWLSFGGVAIGFIMIAFIIVPLFHPLEVTSSFEYLELRFKHPAPRKLASFLSVIMYAIFMGLVLYGPAITLETVTGFPIWGSLVIVAAGAIFYTSLGGFKAVIWADVFQSIIIAVGVVALLIKGIVDAGGIQNVLSICKEEGRLEFSDLRADPTVRHTIWTLLIGNGLTFLFSSFRADPTVRHTIWTLLIGNGLTFFSLGFNQMIIQRISSTKRMKDAKGACICAIPGFILYGSGGCLLGLTAYAYFSYKQCDPLAASLIRSPNQVLPYFVMEIFEKQPGMPGVFLAALFCASLSTLSSGLNSLPMITWEDFIKPHIPVVSEFKATIIGKVLVVVYGFVAVAVAYVVLLIGGPIAQITSSICSCIGGPICGMFVLGGIFRSANYKGSIAGCLVALAVLMWIALGATISGYRTPILPLASTENCDMLLSNNSVYGYYNESSKLNKTLSDETNSREDSIGEYFWLYKLSYLWYTTIGIAISVAVGLLVSHITGGNSETVNDKYLFTFRRHCTYRLSLPKFKGKPFKRPSRINTIQCEVSTPLNIVESQEERSSRDTEKTKYYLRENDGEENTL